MTTLLIDADVICHQLAYKNTRNITFDGEETIEVTQPEKAKANTVEYVESLMDELKADQAILVLSDRAVNFRKEFESTYKAQRTKPKPELWHVIRGLIESGDLEYPCSHLPRLEGDDVLGILATNTSTLTSLSNRIVVSIDKDLQGVPCRLYNPGKPELGVRDISVHDARMFHLSQVLTGDTTDNYKGLPGCGPVRTAQVLDVKTVADAWAAIVAEYVDRDLTEKDAIHQARLAYILQWGDYNIQTNKVKLWTPRRYGIR